VDDDPAVQRVAQRVLQRAGWTVLLADGGPAAIAALRSHAGRAIACAVVDLSMPEMSGEDTVLALRDIRPTLAVVLASGYNEQRLGASVALDPRTTFVQKPFTIEELVSAVALVSGGSDTAREATPPDFAPPA